MTSFAPFEVIILGMVEFGTIPPPTPALPHQGGGSLGSPSPLVGEGALFLPPPPGGRELCFSLPHQGGGSFVSPSPTRGEGEPRLPPPWWGRVGVGGEKNVTSPCAQY